MRNQKILIIDDNPSIHADMRKILCPLVSENSKALDELEAELLGTHTALPQRVASFDVHSAYQGQEGLVLLQQALAEQQPYAMAFVDMRMPPGWDGVQTTLELWKAMPDLQVVVCTAYSDYSWDHMLSKLGNSDRLLILKKPFDTIEVLQLANALTEKWELLEQSKSYAAMLEQKVRARTEQLESANQSLRSEISHRTLVERELVRAKEVAEAASVAKAEFMTNMSHELRTPMNGVIGIAHLLLDSRLDDDQRELTETLLTCGKDLLKLIADVLDFSEMESHQLRLQNVDFSVAEQLNQVLDHYAKPASEKKLALVLNIDSSIPPLLIGDPKRFAQIAFNLIGNAIKFTHAGQIAFSVRCEMVDEQSATLRCECRDSGIGIASDIQKKLFQPFIQADGSLTRQYGGTGLGLVICRILCEMMAGSIGVQSVAGQGATFWFTCKLQQKSHDRSHVVKSNAGNNLSLPDRKTGS